MQRNVIQLMESLADATDLMPFANAGKALQGGGYIDTYTLDITTPSTGMCMLRAWANGLRLLCSNVGGSVLDAPAAVLMMIGALCNCICHQTLVKAHLQAALFKLRSGTLDTEMDMANRVQMAQLLAKAGVLQALADFYSAAAADLYRRCAKQQKLQQQQQQQPVILSKHAASFLVEVLGLWEHLKSWWPGKTLVGSQGLAITVKPVVALAAAVITNCVTIAVDTGTDSGSSSMAADADSRSSPPQVIMSTAAEMALRVSFRVLRTIINEGFSDAHVPVPCVKELVAAGDILMLAAAAIGLWTSRLWQQQQQQHQVCPSGPHHVQLLQKLGCPGLELPSPSSLCVHGALTVNMQLLQVAVAGMEQPQDEHPLAAATASFEPAAAAPVPEQGDTDSERDVGTKVIIPTQFQASNNSSVSTTISSSSSGSGCRELPATELVSTLCELLALLPPDPKKHLSAHLSTTCIIHCVAVIAYASHSSSSIRPILDRDLLLEQLLFVLGPAISRTVQAVAQQQEMQQRACNTEDTGAEAGLCQVLQGDLGRLFSDTFSRDAYQYKRLAAAILKQPQTAISSLCLGLRAVAAEITPNEERDLRSAMDIVEAVKATFCHPSLVADATAAAGASLLVDDPSVAELASPQLQQELLSLLLCCTKIRVLMLRSQSYVAGSMYLASMVVGVSAAMGCLCLRLFLKGQSVADAAATTTSSLICSGYPAADISAWLLLSARALNIIGVAADKLAGMSAENAARFGLSSSEIELLPTPLAGANEQWVVLQHNLRDAVHLSRRQKHLLSAAQAALLPAAGQTVAKNTVAGAADAQLLLQQQDAVLLAIEAAAEVTDTAVRLTADTDGLCSAVSNSSIEEATAQVQVLLSSVAQQLQETGATVCAALPVPYCCNNPGCCSFRGDSEQQLVSGKGCICGGCQVARYCGTDCQTAHWPQHKAVCKTIKKQRAAATA